MKAFILLIISGVLTSAVFIVGKMVGGESLSPLLVLFWQMTGGALVVWLVSWPSRRFPVWNVVHVRYYLLGGLLGVSLPYVLAFLVLQELQVGTVGLLTALSPIVTYGMARSFGFEQGHPLRLAGLMAGLAGVALMVLPGVSVELTDDGLYLLLALGIPVTLAASNIYRSRYWPAGSEAIPLVNGMLTVQGVLLLVINLTLGNFNSVITDIQNAGYLLTLLGVVAGASYLSSFSLLKVGGPVYLSQMGYVITSVTLLAGVIFWGEQYNRMDFISMGLILSGVLSMTLTQRLKQTGKTAFAH